MLDFPLSLSLLSFRDTNNETLTHKTFITPSDIIETILSFVQFPIL